MITNEQANSGMVTGAGLSANTSLHEGAELKHHWKVECHEYAGGPLLWVEEWDNLVTTAGLNKYLDSTLVTGATSPAWYVGLKNTGSAVAGDTMASHAGWTTNTTYSTTPNPAWTGSAPSAGSTSNSGSPATFTMNGSTTIYGAFLTSNSTVGAATGTLFSAGDFGTAQPVISGNTLTVTITLSLT